MYCDSEPTTEVYLRTTQCDGVADCMNSNDEYMCGKDRNYVKFTIMIEERSYKLELSVMI